METVQNAAIVVAVVEALKRTVGVTGVATIVVAALVGAALGFFQGNTAQGLVDGLVAVGAVSVASKASK